MEYLFVVSGIAMVVGIVATVLGALVHEETKFVDCTPSTGCRHYYERGWPLGWTTDTPGWLLSTGENPDYVFRYGSDGVAELAFVVTVVMWGLIAIAAQTVLIFGGSLMWRFIRRQPNPSP